MHVVSQHTALTVVAVSDLTASANAFCRLLVTLASEGHVIGAGYDIEDAIVMNKSSLDRGFGRCVVLRKYGTTMKKYKNRTTDRVVKPTLPPGQVSHIQPGCHSHTLALSPTYAFLLWHSLEICAKGPQPLPPPTQSSPPCTFLHNGVLVSSR